MPFRHNSSRFKFLSCDSLSHGPPRSVVTRRHELGRGGSLLAAVAAPQKPGSSKDSGVQNPKSLLRTSTPPSFSSEDEDTEVVQLAVSLGVSTREVHALLEDCPEILMQPLDRIGLLICRLQEALDVTMDKVLLMIHRKPEVLSCSPLALSRRCEELSALLGIPEGEMKYLVTKQPEFLDMPAESLAIRYYLLRVLCPCLERSQKSYKALITLPRCHRLCGVLSASVPETMKALTKLPASSFHELISMRSSVLKERTAALEELLGVQGYAPYRGPRASLSNLPSKQQEDLELSINDDGKLALDFPLLDMRMDHKMSAESCNEEWDAMSNSWGSIKTLELAIPSGASVAGASQVHHASIAEYPDRMEMSMLRRRVLQKIECKIHQVLPQKKPFRIRGSTCTNVVTDQEAGQHARAKMLSYDPDRMSYRQGSKAHQWRSHHGLEVSPDLAVPDRNRVHGMPPSYTTSLVLKCPRLLLGSALDDIACSYSAILELLQVPQASAMAVLLRAPDLLLIPPRTLWSTANTLTSLLALSHEKLVKSLMQQPAILRLSTDKIQGHFYGLAELLGPISQLPSIHDAESLTRRIFRNQPQILLLSLDSLSCKISGIGECISGIRSGYDSRLVALQSVAKQPAILSLSLGTIQSKLESLSHFFGVKPHEISTMIQEEPTILTLSPRTIEHKLHGLCGLTNMEIREMKLLALAYPALIAVPTANLEYKISEASFLVGVSRQAIVSLLALYPPSVLCIAPSKLKKMLELQQTGNKETAQVATSCYDSRVIRQSQLAAETVEAMLQLPAVAAQEKLKQLLSLTN